MPHDSSIVPVIDVGPFLAGTDLHTAPAQIAEAAENSGFFQIVGHGIDPARIDRVYELVDVLMNLPQEIKDTLRPASGHPYRGLQSNYGVSGRLCSEGFSMSRFDDPQDAVAGGVAPEFASYFHTNVWPPVEGFREAVTALGEQTRDLGRQLMRMFAVALELPIDYFDAWTAIDSSLSSIRSYPARHAPLENGPEVIFDEHFDGGILTILHQRGTYDGLEIRSLDGTWFPVTIHDDAFVINLGALMSRWTNDRWPATRHRVVGAVDPEGSRYTLPTFFNLNPATLVEVLPTTYGTDGPKHEPVTVFDWLPMQMKKTYAERRHTRTTTNTDAYIAALRA